MKLQALLKIRYRNMKFHAHFSKTIAFSTHSEFQCLIDCLKSEQLGLRINVKIHMEFNTVFFASDE